MIIDNKKLILLLKEKQQTKSILAEKLGISSRTIAKIGKGESISKSVVDRIAEFLQVDSNEIIKKNYVLLALQKEKELQQQNGLYHETQIKLTYNSNHMEGSQLTEDQTRYIFETQTIGQLPPNINMDDIIETNNHFRCIDYVIDNANEELDEEYIKTLQNILKSGTNFAKNFGKGEYKTIPNTVGGIETTKPKDVQKEIKKLLNWYASLKTVTFEDIVNFHYEFEVIHPFPDGNGRVGRLIAFKECLKNNIVPFYIDDKNKWLYCRGLQEWKNEKNYLIETCKFGQDQFRQLLDYFEIEY